MPYQGKRYLVTGGAGFIGSHFVEELLSRGGHVSILDDLSTGSEANLAAVLSHPRLEFSQGSVTDTKAVDRLAAGADVIVHLAAAVGVKLIVDDPVRVIDTNVRGAETVLRAAGRRHCRVLIASSSEVYGKSATVPFREDDDLLLGPTDCSRWSYGATKIIGEHLGLAYQKEFQTPVVIARLFNTIGPRQSREYGMVVPRFVLQAMAGEPITVYGDGRQRRCFCDVRDVVGALIGLSSHPKASGSVFNIGARNEVSIGELAEKTKRMTGSNSPIVSVPFEEAYTPGFEDVMRRVPDVSRIQSLLNWTPTWSLDKTLRSIIDYETKRQPKFSVAAL